MDFTLDSIHQGNLEEFLTLLLTLLGSMHGSRLGFSRALMSSAIPAVEAGGGRYRIDTGWAEKNVLLEGGISRRGSKTGGSGVLLEIDRHHASLEETFRVGKALMDFNDLRGEFLDILLNRGHQQGGIVVKAHGWWWGWWRRSSTADSTFPKSDSSTLGSVWRQSWAE